MAEGVQGGIFPVGGRTGSSAKRAGAPSWRTAKCKKKGHEPANSATRRGSGARPEKPPPTQTTLAPHRHLHPGLTCQPICMMGKPSPRAGGQRSSGDERQEF
jgi:hypothetical protein